MGLEEGIGSSAIGRNEKVGVTVENRTSETSRIEDLELRVEIETGKKEDLGRLYFGTKSDLQDLSRLSNLLQPCSYLIGFSIKLFDLGTDKIIKMTLELHKFHITSKSSYLKTCTLSKPIHLDCIKFEFDYLTVSMFI